MAVVSAPPEQNTGTTIPPEVAGFVLRHRDHRTVSSTRLHGIEFDRVSAYILTSNSDMFVRLAGCIRVRSPNERVKKCDVY